jgi:MFS family permease
LSIEKSIPSFAGPGAPSAAGDGVVVSAWRKAGMLVFTASVVMLATLPGRTQGLGLITEPLIANLHVGRVQFANLNLVATLIGALFCFPAGWAFDRFGLKWPTATIVSLLAITVWGFSVLKSSGGMLLFVLIATRGLGQSALSVASITAVGRRFENRVGMPMAVFSVLLSVFFAIAFGVIGYSVREFGWRAAWQQIASFLVVAVVPLILIYFGGPHVARGNQSESLARAGLSLAQALKTTAFWTFAGSAALFNLVSSGLGLFNEAVLAERGFDQKTFHIFLAVTTLLSLVGQFIAGALSKKISYRHLIVMAMTLYAAGLGVLPFVRTMSQLFVLSTIIGLAGGMIIVVFFAVWSDVFGGRHLGRIQGAAQFVTVVSSAIGPVIFAKAFEMNHSYTPLLYSLSIIVLLVGVVALKVRTPNLSS